MKNLIILLIFCFLSCNTKTYKESIIEIAEATYSKAWIAGANSVIRPVNEGYTPTPTELRIKMFKDSTEFSNMLRDKK